jgi:hypothetical protein
LRWKKKKGMLFVNIIEAGFFSASSENRLPPFILKFVE